MIFYLLNNSYGGYLMRTFNYMLLGVLLVILTSCSANEQKNTVSDDGKATQQTKEQTVEVDKGLLNVEVTIPASMFEGKDIDTVIADAKKDGVTEVTKNEDGSLTYKMSKSKHKEMMKEIEESILKAVEDIKNDENFVSIKDITHNKSFSEFTLVVDKSAYENSMDGFATLGLGMSGIMYQLFNGVNADNNKVTIHIKDQATQEVFDEIVYPDDLNKEKTE